MKPGSMLALTENLNALCLTTIRSHLEPQLRQARESALDYDEFLLALTDLEVQARHDNRLKRRVREAKFPLLKTLDGFDYTAAPELDRRLINELAQGEYVTQGRNVLLVGKSGTGKTHLATGLGIEACRQGIQTRFVTACALVNELLEAQQDRSLSRVLKRYGRYGVVIIDELGYIPFSRPGADLLFQVLAERHERKPVIITTNLGFGDWTQVFGDVTLTATLLDRLTHKAHIISCGWESYRLRESMRTKRK